MRRTPLAFAFVLVALSSARGAVASGYPPRGNIASVELGRSAGATCELREDENRSGRHTGRTTRMKGVAGQQSTATHGWADTRLVATSRMVR
jgi:hypothetical protein